MNPNMLTPERISQLATGGWAAAALGTAVTYGVFTHLDRGHRTVDAIAAAAGISTRGTRALLDGLVGLGLLTRSGDLYANGPEAAEFLVEGKPAYSGGFARMCVDELKKWAELPQVVKSGRPADDVDVVENPFWEDLVLSIAPSSRPTAQAAAAGLRIAEAGPVQILDVGGGSGVYSAVLLGQNPQARSTQLDWANVNQVARKFVAGHGVGDRFDTLDGDFRKFELPAARYDVIVYSHIAHMESPEENTRVFARLKAALRPEGTLVIVDFVQRDDRSGPPFALLFHMNMLVHTQAGATYTESEYRAWLAAAGFRDVRIERSDAPAAIIYAR